jgi:hypothetical protein
MKFLCAASFVCLIVSSCKQGVKSGTRIPADAAVAIHINTPSLSSKLSWEEIKQTDWYKEVYAEASDSLAQKILADPENSGIDTKSDLFFFMKQQSNGSYVGFEGTLKDAATFEAFNKKLPGSSATTKEGDLSVIRTKEGAVVTWNKDHFIYLSATGALPSYTTQPSDGQDNPSSQITADSLQKYAKQLYSMESDESLAANDKFSSLLKEKGDLHIWVNSENLYNNMGAGMMSLMKVNVLFDGNRSASTINFDDGRITMKSRQYYNEQMNDFIKKYNDRNIDKEVVNRIPSKNVAAAFVMSYKPEGLKDFMKLIGVDGVVNGFLGEAGYSIDEFIKANKGDMVIAVTDFEVKNKVVTIPNEEGGEPYTYNSTQPDVKVLFSTSINDRPAFDKMVGVLKAKMGDQASASMPEVTYNLNNNWFAASNSAAYVDQFLKGSSNDLGFADKISGHPFGMFVDLNTILKGSESSATDSSARASLRESINMWQNAILTGGEFKDGAVVYEGEVNLVNKSVNSLKQLNEYANKLSRNMKQKEAQVTTDDSASFDAN